MADSKKKPIASVTITADDPAIRDVIESEIVALMHSLGISCEHYMVSPGHEAMLQKLKDLGLTVRIISKDTRDG